MVVKAILLFLGYVDWVVDIWWMPEEGGDVLTIHMFRHNSGK